MAVRKVVNRKYTSLPVYILMPVGAMILVCFPLYGGPEMKGAAEDRR
jgi:hypothetical protein